MRFTMADFSQLRRVEHGSYAAEGHIVSGQTGANQR